MTIDDGPGAPLFVDRESETRTLEDAITTVAGGAARAVALVGEPGIGKTALLRQARLRASAAGLDVAFGRGTEFDSDAPFSLIVEALDETLEQQGSEWLEGLGAERRAELARVFPGIPS